MKTLVFKFQMALYSNLRLSSFTIGVNDSNQAGLDWAYPEAKQGAHPPPDGDTQRAKQYT